ncbi:hypothetical protein GCM10027346_30280 [Hymenobacter seoulensis]
MLLVLLRQMQLCFYPARLNQGQVGADVVHEMLAGEFAADASFERFRSHRAAKVVYILADS